VREGRLAGHIVGEGLTTGYVYLAATETQVREARLRLRRGAQWIATADSRYPYEFSSLEGGAAVEFRMEAVDAKGAMLQSGPLRLERTTAGARP
jgi:hypothetical protein